MSREAAYLPGSVEESGSDEVAAAARAAATSPVAQAVAAHSSASSTGGGANGAPNANISPPPRATNSAGGGGGNGGGVSARSRRAPTSVEAARAGAGGSGLITKQVSVEQRSARGMMEMTKTAANAAATNQPPQPAATNGGNNRSRPTSASSVVSRLSSSSSSSASSVASPSVQAPLPVDPRSSFVPITGGPLAADKGTGAASTAGGRSPEDEAALESVPIPTPKRDSALRDVASSSLLPSGESDAAPRDTLIRVSTEATDIEPGAPTDGTGSGGSLVGSGVALDPAHQTESEQAEMLHDAAAEGWVDPRSLKTPPGIIHPMHPWLLSWSAIIMGVAIYNTFTIPYRWTFWEEPYYMTWDVVLLLVCDAVGDVCFLVDMWKNFHTAYMDDGMLVVDRSKIQARYLRSWFILDVITCLPLDIIQLGMMQLVPAVRVPKILRIFQVLHHVSIIEKNTTVSLTFRLSKLLFYTGVLAHGAGCVKYPIMMGNPALKPMLEKRTAFNRYLLSIYWSTGALIDRGDVTDIFDYDDYLISVLTMVVGVLWVAYFVASLEEFTSSGQGAKTKYQAEVKQVMRFMHQLKLPRQLQDQVKAYFSYFWSSPLRFDMEEILTEANLPPALESDVRMGLTGGVLLQADLFQGVSNGFLAHLLPKLTSLITVPGEVICQMGHSALEMYFILDGEVEILVGKKGMRISTLRRGDEFGSYGLLVSEVRTATARSVDYATMLVLARDDLEESIDLFPAAGVVIRNNAVELRARTDQQERMLTGLDSGNGGADGSSKLKKLMNVNQAVNAVSQKKGWTISPNSVFYQRWSIVYMLVVFWNSIMVPVRFGFLSTQVSPIVLTIDYLGDLFLIADIFLTFRVKYISKGSEVSDLRDIAAHYRRGWLLWDIAASLPLDFVMIKTGMEPLLRLNRCIRIVHLHEMINNKLKESKYEDLFSLLYLIANLLFLSHWASSIYFAFTRYVGFASEEGMWQPAERTQDANVLYQYVVAQYFAMGLLSGVGGTIFPPNSLAVIFTLAVMMTGLFVVSYLIGSLGNLLFSVQEMTVETNAEETQIKLAMDYRKVDSDVQRRVVDYMHHIWNAQKGVDPNEALSRLPSQLRMQIMQFVCEAHLRAVPRFKDMPIDFIRALVGELTFVELPAREWVFKQGYLGDAMYFISKVNNKGFLDIVLDNGVEETVVKSLGPGSFFGEGALFAGTRAAGVRTKTPVRLFALSAASFSKVMHMYPSFAERLLDAHQARHAALRQKKQMELDATKSGGRRPHGSPATTARTGHHSGPNTARPQPLGVRKTQTVWRAESSRTGVSQSSHPETPAPGGEGAASGTEGEDDDAVAGGALRTQLASAAAALIAAHKTRNSSAIPASPNMPFKRVVSNMMARSAVQQLARTAREGSPLLLPSPAIATSSPTPLALASPSDMNARAAPSANLAPPVYTAAAPHALPAIAPSQSPNSANLGPASPSLTSAAASASASASPPPPPPPAAAASSSSAATATVAAPSAAPTSAANNGAEAKAASAAAASGGGSNKNSPKSPNAKPAPPAPTVSAAKQSQSSFRQEK